MSIEYKKRVVVVKNSCKFFFFIFRRERDSNPWYDYSYVSLAMKYFRPLSHLSRDKNLIVLLLNHTRPLGLEPRTSGFGDLRSTN